PSVRKRFSITLESFGVGEQGPGELVVERAQYSRDTPTLTNWTGATGPYWPAGSNNLATPLR
ncbi:MAG: hypothetical protein KJ061_00605, partial [Vicinamibacteraceae bacterium]|nr:hypothetical protein [Vicinamibacteraceae bacterium]